MLSDGGCNLAAVVDERMILSFVLRDFSCRQTKQKGLQRVDWPIVNE